MLRVGEALMHSFARSMNLPEDFFDRSFEHGISTLRLIRYPPRVDLDQAAAHHPDVWVEREGRRCHVSGAAHVDSGLVTLLAQDRVPGLQARHRAGHWIDIPPLDGTLAVNFGKVLERWSRGRMKATEHRVIGSDRERASIPFFYEARVDAAIRPLPMDPPDCFEPFLYGDHLWDRVTGFVEFHGMAGLRQARR
jgi:isopenicillin N synthase-like dioxygenase